jgi:acyl-coenzyme A thioesterase PaaI-like protein
MDPVLTQIPSLWNKIPGYNCFGCSPDNHRGLSLQFFEDETGVRSNFNLSAAFSSYPGVVHCGIVVTILEEVMGNVLVVKGRKLGFTLRLQLKYIGPVLVGQDYRAHAKIRVMSDDFPEVEGNVYDAEGGLVVRARGIYRVMSPQEAMKVMEIDEPTMQEFQAFLR